MILVIAVAASVAAFVLFRPATDREAPEPDQAVIFDLIRLVELPAESQEEIINKAEAIQALGEFRTPLAIPVLLAEIDFENIYNLSSEFIIENSYPAVGALQKIGQPASSPTLAQIGRVRLDVEGAEEAEFEILLLVLVLQGIEGRAATESMIMQRLAGESEQGSAAYRKALAFLQD